MKIQFYKSSSDRSYFEDFIDKLHKQDKARVLAVFEDIRKYGRKQGQKAPLKELEIARKRLKEVLT